MLLPESGLIDRLILALEEASGDNRLSDDEHLLLSRLQKLKGDLEVMRPNDSSAWKGIARQLEHLNEPAPAADPPRHGQRASPLDSVRTPAPEQYQRKPRGQIVTARGFSTLPARCRRRARPTP